MDLLFELELGDVWGTKLNKIIILDEEMDNVIVNDNKYSISYDDIDEIKEFFKNENLSLNGDIVNPPVLDGTFYKISYGDKDFSCYNLWYWKEEDPFVKGDIVTETDVKFTKAVVDMLNRIQVILRKNNIKFNVFSK